MTQKSVVQEEKEALRKAIDQEKQDVAQNPVSEMHRLYSPTWKEAKEAMEEKSEENSRHGTNKRTKD